MGQLFEYIKMALSNIKMNKGRSFLTMLGIIIGVSSVILIMSIGNGAKSEMENELTSVAGGQIYIYANSNLDGEIPTVTAEDRDALRKLPGVKGVSSMAGSILNSVKTGKGNFEAVVDYTDPDYEYSTNPTMLYGHWFTWDDYDSGLDVAVLSEKDAIRMFGTADVVGLTFEMDDGSSIKDVRIVGVKKALDGTFVNEGYGDYLGITVPLTSDSYWAENQDFDSVYLFSENTSATAELAEKGVNLLNARHGMTGQDAFLTEDFAGGGYFFVGRRHWRYEYYAGIRHRADTGDWNPKSIGCPDEINSAAVPGRVRHYYRHWRHDWDCNWNCRGLCRLRTAYGQLWACSQCRSCHWSNCIFLYRWYLLRNLSCKKSGTFEPD